MRGAYPLIGLLVWLQFKHFVADYLLQPVWILRGKGDLRHPGGYAHAGIHALGSLPALMLMNSSATYVTTIALGELAAHFTIDHLKAIYSVNNPTPITTRIYWAAHGADQMLHHLTYAVILLLVSRFGQ